MRMEQPIITLILAALVFTGMFAFVTSVADSNTKSYTVQDFETQNGTTLIDAFNSLNDTKAEMVDLQTEFSDSSVLDSGSVFPFVSLALKIGKQIFTSLNIFKVMLEITSELLGIPPMYTASFFAIIMISFLIVVVMIIAGRTY